MKHLNIGGSYFGHFRGDNSDSSATASNQCGFWQLHLQVGKNAQQKQGSKKVSKKQVKSKNVILAFFRPDNGPSASTTLHVLQGNWRFERRQKLGGAGQGLLFAGSIMW